MPLTGTPKGRLFPLSRDELVECAALLDSVREAVWWKNVGINPTMAARSLWLESRPLPAGEEKSIADPRPSAQLPAPPHR